MSLRSPMHRLVALLALLGTLLAGCHGPGPSAPSPPLREPSSAFAPGAASPLARGPDDGQGPVPIYPEDARWGSANAPVTIVAVLDLECPFCERAEATLEALRQHYGPGQLRIVVKHYPLPFHPFARAAALAAIRVERAAGDEAFFRFVTTVYAHQRELSSATLAEWARAAARTGRGRPSTVSPEEQLARDHDFAERVGATGTPCFFVNGAILTGAQPYEQFSSVVDAELAQLQAARLAGKSIAYADRVAVNYVAPSAAPATPDADEDLVIWKIPVGSSPTLGPADALVTIVEFSDYECPFCKRVEPTLEALRARYGGDLRLVFKHNPLPFHTHARPAAELALEAFHQKGNAGFWEASKALFDASAENMTEDGLLRMASTLALDPRKAKAAIQKAVHDGEIEADTELALDFHARGTPHFFINGRRLAGAQPLERFAEVVDAQLAVARLLVQKGVPRNKVYETILDHAEEPAPPSVVDLGPLTPGHASRGPANAVIVIREFSDFQCPFCNRVLPTLDLLRKEFPREVKIVWHNLPLDFHAHARAAANAALEVRDRGGDTAFWKMHDLLFANQTDLSDEKLAELGKAAGVSATAILTAIREGRHDAVIDEDRELAERAGIRGTPGFVINGYVVSGAQPLTEFRRTVRRALADQKRGVLPKPNTPALPHE